MILSLDVRRARKGDCLLLHYGSAKDPGLILIDGGPSSVYGPSLQPRLSEIREARGLGDDDALPIDLLLVSHVDDDHIKGILEMTQELTTLAAEQRPLPYKIRQLWHNSFDDIIGNTPKELLASITASHGAASLGSDELTDEIWPETQMVLANVSQGIRLRDDARRLKVKLNQEFKGKLVMAKGASYLDMGRKLRFTVAGPMKPELDALQKAHDKFLKEQQAKREKAALAAFTDTSVANLSSIVVLAEVDDKRILLTGDARGDKILQGLEMVGLLQSGETMHVDVLKVPHHGSDRNTAVVFFQRVTANHYVFSGDGEHGNPERDTLQMLLDARGDANLTIHLTYPVDEIDENRRDDWIKERAKDEVRKLHKPEIKVRSPWSKKEHSLTSFFEGNKDFAEKVRTVPKKGRHVIDLLDNLTY
jgi:hypothetical protein